MRVAVKLFGSIREAVGEKELSVELPDGASARDLRRLLAGPLPVFDTFGDRLAVSVQLEVVPLDTALRDGDEVAFLPPVSGGAGQCWISDRPLEEAEAVARVKGPGMGGIVTFVGAVRDHARGRSIRHLEYEAYPEMAVREMEKIAERGGAALAGHARRDRPPLGPSRGRRDRGGDRRGGAAPRGGVRRLPLRDRHAQADRPDLEEGSRDRRRVLGGRSALSQRRSELVLAAPPPSARGRCARCRAGSSP